MENHSKNYVQVLLATFIVFIFYSFFLSISQTFSPFFAWDMDHVTVLDSLLIQGGRLPSHIHHPGFGMYAVDSWAHRIAAAFNLVSFSSMKDVASSINPVLGMAELSTFLRQISPALCAAIPFLLWLSVVNIFRISILFSLLLLFLLCTQTSLYYHAGLIRSELYAIFFWSLAIFLFSLSVASTHRTTRIIAILLSGAMLSISILSKLQALFYILAAPVLYLLMLEWNQYSAKSQVIDLSEKWRIRLSGFNLVFSILLVICSLFRSPYGTTYTDKYPINPMGIAVMLIPLLLFLLERKYFGNFIKLRVSTRSVLQLLFTGFFLAYFLHFLIIFPPVVGLKYMLLDAKMLFFREQTRPGQWGGLYLIYHAIQANFHYAWHTFLLAISVFAIAFYRIRISRERKLLIILLLFIFLSVTYGIRNTLRDVLWLEIAIHTSTAFLLALLWTKGSGIWKFLAPLIAALAIISKICHISTMGVAINSSAHTYHRDWEKFLNAIQTGEQEVYTEIIRAKLGIENNIVKEKFIEQALHWRRIRDQAEHQFPSHRIDLTRIGLLEKGMPVWRDSEKDGYVFESIPSRFIGLPTADTWEAEVTHTYISPNAAYHPSDDPNVLTYKPKSKSLAAMTRLDLNIYLAVDKAIPIENKYLQALPESIHVRKGAEQIELQVYRLLAYNEFDNLPRKSLWFIEQLHAIPR